MLSMTFFLYKYTHGNFLFFSLVYLFIYIAPYLLPRTRFLSLFVFMFLLSPSSIFQKLLRHKFDNDKNSIISNNTEEN